MTGRLKGPITESGLYVFTAAGNFQLVNEPGVVVNKTSGAATTVSLPKGPNKGRKVTIKDGKGDSGTNNITINTPDSKTIDGASSYVLSVNYSGAVMQYNGTEWNVLVNFSAGGTSRVEVNTPISTAGAGSLTAASIVGGVITRTGPSAAYTDTTVAASAIIAALPGAQIGRSWMLEIKNMVAFPETVAGGSGVTVSGIALVPPLSVGKFLVTYNGAGTVTIVGLGSYPLCNVPPSKVTTGTAATFAAGDITGAAFVHYINNASNASLTVRTAAQMFADIPNCQVGFSYALAIRNLNATGATLTADGGATVTLSGTMTIAQNETRFFNVVFPSATTCTITSMGKSAAAA